MLNHTQVRRRGFTLIELLVAVAIIGLISTLVAVAINNARQKSRDGLRKGNLNQIKNALELHLQQYGAYPVSSSSGAAFDCINGIPNPGLTQLQSYITPLPLDPLNSGTNGQRDSVAEGCIAYRSAGTQYKLVTALELDVDLMANDGGIRSCWFELYTSGGQVFDPGLCP